MTLHIYPIQTGRVRIKSAQIARKPLGPWRLVSDSQWSQWLPIYAWLIDHPEGPILVDTGETCRVCQPGYFPPWHPYYRLAAEFDVAADQEIGPALLRLGLRPQDVPTVIMTHLHTDHAGGLHHFPKSTIWVSQREWQDAQGVMGKLRGYVSHRWPHGLAPKTFTFPDTPFGPFAGFFPMTKSEDVMLVPTPGHTPGHISVLVRDGGLSYFLAGDASYTEATLIARIPDGVTFFPKTAVATLTNILAYARTEKTIYLPAHDPQAEQRLREGSAVMVPTNNKVPLMGARARL